MGCFLHESIFDLSNSSKYIESIKDKPKVIEKEAFDKIYRRFMTDKRSQEMKLEEKRRAKKMREEEEIQKLHKSLKRVGSKSRINNYINKVQEDIKNRNFKAERIREKRAIDEQRQLSQMFKPKTNVSRQDMPEVYRSSEIRREIRKNEEDIITFEQSKEFNQ